MLVPDMDTIEGANRNDGILECRQLVQFIKNSHSLQVLTARD